MLKRLLTFAAVAAMTVAAHALNLPLTVDYETSDADAPLYAGWNSSYDRTTQTITYAKAWAGRGWWLDGEDYSEYTHVKVVIEPVEFNTQLVVEYTDDDAKNSTFGYNAGVTELIAALNPDYSNSVKQIYLQASEEGTVTLVSAEVYSDIAVETTETAFTIDGGANITAPQFADLYDEVVVRLHIVNESDPFESRNGWGIGQMSNIDNWSKTEYSFELTGAAGEEFDLYCTVGDMKKAAKNGTSEYVPGEYHPTGGVTFNVYNDCKLVGAYAQIPSNKLTLVEADPAVNEYVAVSGGYAADVVVLTDGYKYDNTDVISVASLNYKRTYSNTEWWQAWHMPFSVELDDLKPYLMQNAQDQKYEIIEFVGVVEEDGESYAEFTLLEDADETTVKAGTPYLFIPADTEVKYEFADVELQAATPGTVKPQGSSYQLVGTYDVTTALQAKGAYVVSGGMFKTVNNDTAKLRPFRAYLSPIASGKGGSKLAVRVVDANDDNTDTDAIESIAIDALQGGQMYDLNGRPVSHPTRGIYILNGQKIIIR